LEFRIRSVSDKILGYWIFLVGYWIFVFIPSSITERTYLLNIDDTICAVCTGVGGAVSIIRISGPEALSSAHKVWRGTGELGPDNARKMLLGRVLDPDSPETGDTALAVFMPGPNSYTGDDVVELHCHGGALATKRALQSVLKVGTRGAEPGEFTFRAFVNGKMDLTQAEAVCDIITAHSNMALHLAERQIDGLLGRCVRAIKEILVDMLAEIESRLDFPEEELDWVPPEQLFQTTVDAMKDISELGASRREGVVLRDGIRVVLAGCPNAGKSSLLNHLLGRDRAIVTQFPGTTRDTLEEFAHLRGVPVTLIDTAGIREADDLIEGIGVDRSRRSIEQAQVVFWLLDASGDVDEELAEMRQHTAGHRNVIAIWNKIDLADDKDLPEAEIPTAKISVTDGLGFNEMLDLFEAAVWEFPHTEEPEIAVSSRHAALLDEASLMLVEIIPELENENWELTASCLRSSISALGAITGETADVDVLDNIFSRFCIGK
jgi:tRNA modification GTPase